jgi:hypothetical protein
MFFEAILVYWMSLAFIPKGVLEKIRKLTFRFLWSGSKEKKGIVWVTWNYIAIPKGQGGWGIKNIHLFSKALATKCVWRLIEGKGLWCQVITQKYMFLIGWKIG